MSSESVWDSLGRRSNPLLVMRQTGESGSRRRANATQESRQAVIRAGERLGVR